MANGGAVYLGLYLVLIFCPIFPLFQLIYKPQNSSNLDLQVLISLGFFGVIIGNLFLHLWEAQTVALMWTLLYFLGQLSLLKQNEQNLKLQNTEKKPGDSIFR